MILQLLRARTCGSLIDSAMPASYRLWAKVFFIMHAFYLKLSGTASQLNKETAMFHCYARLAKLFLQMKHVHSHLVMKKSLIN